MPRLAKGGKWVYGWVVVTARGEITIPPAAQNEYGFRVGDELILVLGSQRSGGFGLGAPARMATYLGTRALGCSRIDEGGHVLLPPGLGVQPGDRLVVVKGSGHALGFIARGPIYEVALQHPEIETF